MKRAEEQKAANARALEMRERRKEQDRLEDAKQLEYIRMQEAAARYVWQHAMLLLGVHSVLQLFWLTDAALKKKKSRVRRNCGSRLSFLLHSKRPRTPRCAVPDSRSCVASGSLERLL